ncbi:MAG: hypothetical protein E7480_01330 [Ruminococcaceae bacterium]|nr:hypothetical protein [Oscillospiraceae bacterium]
MKKIISLLILAVLLLSCFAGCSPKSAGDTSSDIVSGDFEKPENYATVMLVTINPQFRLYLDEEGVVLAVEAINDDAKTIKNISFKDQKAETVVQNLVVAANDGGFIKENAVVDIKIASVKDNDVTEILDKVKTSVNTKLTEMKIEAEVKASVSKDILPEEDSSSQITSSEEISSDTSSVESSSEPSSNTSSAPACKHTNKKATPAATGKNTIDASKLDMVNHNLVCADCNASLGTEAHKVENGKCTLCSQNNFAQKKFSVVNASYTWDGYPDIKDSGAVSYEVMLMKSWNAAAKDEYAVDEWHYKVPEADMLATIRNKFVITDAQFEELKALGRYSFLFGGHTYSNGFFNIELPAAGGPPEYEHKEVGYVDNGQGKFTVYMDCVKCDYEADPPTLVHDYYYAVEYTYSGFSNLSIVQGDYSFEIAGFTPVVDSLRVTSIKKVASIPSDMIKL